MIDNPYMNGIDTKGKDARAQAAFDLVCKNRQQYPLIQASPDEDRLEHWDFIVPSTGKVDIKARKSINRDAPVTDMFFLA